MTDNVITELVCKRVQLQMRWFNTPSPENLAALIGKCKNSVNYLAWMDYRELSLRTAVMAVKFAFPEDRREYEGGGVRERYL